MAKCEHEFNTGFVSALSKFYGHLHQGENLSEIKDFRIYGATDYLLDIEIPEILPPELQGRVKRFVDRAIKLRFTKISRREGDILFNECDEIMQEIDRKCFKLEHVCSHYR